MLRFSNDAAVIAGSIIVPPSLSILQHVISSYYLPEPLDVVNRLWLAAGMELRLQLLKRACDLLLRGRAADAERFVIVAFYVRRRYAILIQQ